MRRLAFGKTTLALFLVFVAPSALGAPPTILQVTVSEVSTESVTLLAELSPGNKSTLYRFEYGSEDCSTSTCTKVPVPDGVIPAGSSPVPVLPFELKGLTPGTTYHLRLVAKNSDGEVKGLDRTFATHVPAFNGLPDGRAYEQASPVRKNAADARGSIAWVKAADDGNAVSFLSTSGIPGGEGEQEVPAYLASRGAAHWSTQGLLPLATKGNEAFIRGWLPDFSAVFEFAGSFGGATDGTFLARSSADGSLAEIVGHGEGLERTDAAYAGASADGSLILFEADIALDCCSAALDGKPNLYLWDRKSGQISLISVLNDGTSPPKGAVAGPYDWMQSETLPLSASGGGSASAYYTQDMHAISAEGDVVYFTATGKGELYARLNPTAAQSPLNGEDKCLSPALACTVHVSASQRTTPDPLGSRPAAFMAATPDGQAAFFTSPEELTNDANAGPIQPPAAIERAKVSGPPIEAKLPITATGIAIDDEFVYWVNPQQDAIGRAELDGDPSNPTFIQIPPRKECPPGKEGCSPEEEALIETNPQYVAVDSEHVYWTSEWDGGKGKGTIGRADIEGKPESIEPEWIKGATRPRGIAVNATHVFWAKAGDGSTADGSIGRAKVSDGGEINHIFIPTQGTEGPEGITLDASHVYWTMNDPAGSFGSLRRNDLTDGSNQIGLFIAPGAELRGIALDATHIYWASQGDEAVGRVPIGALPIPPPADCKLLISCEREFIPTSGKPKGLAQSTTATDLYWAVNGEVSPNPGNDLYRYRPGEGSLLDLTKDVLSSPNGAEVKGVLDASEDGRRVYFAANGDLDDGGPAEAGDCRGSLPSVFVFFGHCSLYLGEETAPDTWSTNFVSRLDAQGVGDVSDATNWLSKSSVLGRHQKTAMASADGSVLLFRSQEQLSEFDNEGEPELYRFELGEGVACVSCNPSGEAPIGAMTLGSILTSALEPQLVPASVQARSLSADGNRVFFETPDALVIDDTNGEAGCELEGAPGRKVPSCLDVYEWVAEGTGSCKEDVQGGGCLYLLSTGTSPNASFFADASVSGDDAFIVTRSAGLVGQDQDQLLDVFDLRVGGGLAAQNQSPVPDCESIDGCHASATPPPGFQSPGSADFSGPGNKKQARKAAKKRRHKKRGNKKRRQRAKRAAREAAGTGGGSLEANGQPTKVAEAAGEAREHRAHQFSSGAPVAAAVSASAKPAWKITSASLPTNFAPGSQGEIFLVADNLGAKATEGTVTITDEVPVGLGIAKNEKGEFMIEPRTNDFGAPKPTCGVVAQTVTCATEGPIRSGYQIQVRIFVKAPPSPETAINKATVSGGGADDATATSTVIVDPTPATFGFLPGSVGLDGPFTDTDGAPATQAGSHPHQLTMDVGFPTKIGGKNALVAAGAVHDVTIDLPRGVVINPAATTELCTEAELITSGTPGCPAASQIGTISPIGVAIFFEAATAALYNMVPPPGEAAALGFEAFGIGIYIHVLGEVRSDGDYGLSGRVEEIPALPAHPAFGSRVDLWGDPSAEVHDGIRGDCAPPISFKPELCPVPRANLAFLTLPGECSGEPLRFEATAHSWEERNVEKKATYDSANLAGNPAQVKGCDQLKFEPTLKLRPTTNLAESPSGLEAELTQAQSFDLLERSTAPLRDAVVTLPQGLIANASQADGLEVCSAAQIGLKSGVGGSPVRLSKDPDQCPDAAKIGTVEVESPLLVQRDGVDEDEIVLDSNGDPVPRPVHGALYLAKPFNNPFASLLAIYIVVDDPRSGVIAKLAGRVEPDPVSGQLTTRFTENPQLPLSDVRLKLFSGSRAPLQTPPTCGDHTTSSTLTPWAAPDLPDSSLTDTFQITSFPGGACPPSEAGAPNAPAFTAGTLTPKAGAFSPMALKLTREDGSQRLAKLDITLPAGISARLVGVGQCSEAQIAAAQARSAPEEGKLEQASPSCPASSEMGIINAGAGAGPTPTYIQGRAYLAGPYKGAPLSVVAITPAVAGPFDLGVVAVRTALYLDPTTAQARAISDPLPQILHGIPANVRSVALHVTREPFTLNPTSCDPKSFTGAAISALGQIAPLTDRFQVGGCEPLPFKPKLQMRLFGPTNRGAHPRFRAILTTKGGEANISRSVVTLPKSEFIDQAHFQTICTRVQYAANQCPAGSIYGFVKAISPLLDYPVQGPIYLRSSNQELPDVVLALRGPAHQPIAIDVVGHVDSVKGRLRTTFETIPDAPISKAIITLRGASKGLFQNSTNICRGAHRATVKLDAHNGKIHDTRPMLKASCKGAKGKGRKGKKGRR